MNETLIATQDVRGKILETARVLFIQKGYNGASIRDIASASETNVAMVNYYFRSKLNLFTEIFNEAFGVVTGKVFTIVESDLPFFEMIRKWIYAYYEVLINYPGFPLFVMNAISQHQEELMKELKMEFPEKIFEKLKARFEEEEAKGTIKPTPLLDFLLNLASLCIFPFAFSPIANTVFKINSEEYKVFLDNHKAYVADFVINSIKK